MSLFSDTKAAFSSGNRDYEEDYEREYDSRYSRSRSYSRYDEPEEEEYYPDEEEGGWHPLKNFFEKRRQKREDKWAEEEAAAEAEEEQRRARAARRSGADIRYGSTPPGGVDVELVVFYPQTIDDSDRIVEAVQGGKLVMFIFEAGEGARNADAASDGTARRIVDYVGGAAKGMNCGFGRLSSGIFCIAPKNVKIPQDRGRRRF